MRIARPVFTAGGVGALCTGVVVACALVPGSAWARTGSGATPSRALRAGRGSPSEGSPSSAALAVFPPVVAQALGDLAGHVRDLPLAGPTVLPPEPPSHTYLTATTRAGRTAWLVRVVKTDAPYAVNNPLITRPRSHPVAVANFGVVRLTASLPRIGTPALAAFLWGQSLAATGRDQAAVGPVLPPLIHGQPVNLGLGISGTLYPVGVGTVTLVWQEGDWTLAVRDTLPATAVAVARPLVVYLHHAFLPPAPGLVAVSIGVHGIDTRVAWVQGAWIDHVENTLVWGDNPVAACAMAVHWHNA